MSFGVGSVAVALVVGGKTAAVVVGFAFTFAVGTSLGFDAVFFAGFGLAAVVVGAFGTIGTTVSTASVAPQTRDSGARGGTGGPPPQ